MRAALALLAAVASSCFSPNFQNGVPCSEDRQCPEGQVCASDDRCYDPDQLPDFDGGLPQCTANETVCESDTLVECDGDGNIIATETCPLGCVESTRQIEARCAYLVPSYLPDACETAADEATFDVGSDALLDTGLDANCNGGVVTQADGPEICVMRYASFRIQEGATLEAVGSRALAVVTDSDLDISGTLDISANGLESGPGGGTIDSGTISPNEDGAGGAGFGQGGAAGGATTDGGGPAGGNAINPIPLMSLVGGSNNRRSASDELTSAGGGGGGAATLIACRGSVVVSETGVVAAGGGGGRGGGTFAIVGQTALIGGGGGGAGGHVVFQGPDVQLAGALFANGGGGGGGGGNLDVGDPGRDGKQSESTPASGGEPGISTAGAGGPGGTQNTPPGVGLARESGSAGGGGGGVGVFRVIVPDQGTATLTPAAASPQISPTESGTTR